MLCFKIIVSTFSPTVNQATSSVIRPQFIIVGYRLGLPEEGLVVILRYHAYLCVGLEHLPQLM